MGDRRPKRRTKHQATARPSGPDVFAEFGLSAADFEIESGGGKSVISGQRIVWMIVRHRVTGRTTKGKIGTTKKGAAQQYDVLLRILLRSFRQS